MPSAICLRQGVSGNKGSQNVLEYNKKIRASHKFITRIFGYLLPGTSAVLILNLGSGMEILGMGHKKSWSGPCSTAQCY